MPILKEFNKVKISKNIIKSAIPSSFSSLIIYLLESINLIFASKVNTDITNAELVNAIGIGNIFMNFGGFLFGLGMINSLETLCSQAWGMGDRYMLSKWVKICIYVMFLYFIFLTVLTLFSDKIIILIGQSENIAYLSSTYLYSLIPSYIFQFYLAIYTKVLNSQQIYNIVTIINIIGLVLHPLWCYIFFYKLKLFKIGLGISYSITSLIMLMGVFFYVTKYGYTNYISFKEIKISEIKDFMITSFHSGLLCSTDVLAFELISLIASYLPQDQIDGHLCVINFYNNIYSISIGFSTTNTNFVGNYIGKGKYLKAKLYAKLGIIINLIFTLMISILILVFHKNIAKLYITKETIFNISNSLMFVIGIFIIFDACHLQLSGVIRGLGLQKDGMIIGIIVFIILQTGSNFLLVFVFKFDIFSLWYCQIVCAVIACILYFIYLFKLDWKAISNGISRSENLEEMEYKTNIN